MHVNYFITTLSYFTVYLGRLLSYILSIAVIFMYRRLILMAWRHSGCLTLIRLAAMLEQGETTALRQRSCTTKLQTATRGKKIRQLQKLDGQNQREINRVKSKSVTGSTEQCILYKSIRAAHVVIYNKIF